MDLPTPYLLPKTLQKYKKVLNRFLILFLHILTFGKSKYFKVSESMDLKNVNVIFNISKIVYLSGPKQLVSPIVSNKNGRAGWWAVDKSLKSPNLKT